MNKLNDEGADKSSEKSPIEKPSRTPSPRTTLFLLVRAGGRCEFDGCNEYLLENLLTSTAGNFGEQAHIFAFKEKGPRGSEEGRPMVAAINAVGNLMLLCKRCHKEIDVIAPEKYPVEVLREFKREHESRIRSLTGISKNRTTIPIVLKGQIAGRLCGVSDEEMQSAAAPSYPVLREKVEVDLTAIPDSSDESFWKTGMGLIDAKLSRLETCLPKVGDVLRISVFGIGPIPLLVYLGSQLSDKLDIDLYQLHRNHKSWTWKEGEGDALFVTKRIREGEDGGDVIFLINLSGKNVVEDLPTKIAAKPASIYELTLQGSDPTPLFLNTRSDLARFQDEYIRALAAIRAAHPSATHVHLFPAVPAPVAVALGLGRLPKVDPSFLIYDKDKRSGGFVQTLEIA